MPEPDETAEPRAAETLGERCANCATPLLGRWCYRCGQESHDPLRGFRSLLADSLENIFHFDARIRDTLFPLLFRPGALTLEYLRGHRVRQVAPFRLMFFLALAAFLVFRLALPPPHVTSGKAISALFAHDRTVAAVAQTRNALLAKIRRSLRNPRTPPFLQNLLRMEEGNVARAARARDRVLQGAAVPARPGPERDIRPRTETRAAAQAVQPPLERFLRRFPLVLVLLMPIFALILKAFFRRRLYAEHLLVALHSHAFLFLDLLLAVGLAALARTAGSLEWLAWPLKTLSGVILAWIPVYLFLMQKRIYALGWRRTFLTFPLIAIAYAIPLGALTILTFTLSVWH